MASWMKNHKLDNLARSSYCLSCVPHLTRDAANLRNPFAQAISGDDTMLHKCKFQSLQGNKWSATIGHLQSDGTYVLARVISLKIHLLALFICSRQKLNEPSRSVLKQPPFRRLLPWAFCRYGLERKDVKSFSRILVGRLTGYFCLVWTNGVPSFMKPSRTSTTENSRLGYISSRYLERSRTKEGKLKHLDPEELLLMGFTHRFASLMLTLAFWSHPSSNLGTWNSQTVHWRPIATSQRMCLLCLCIRHILVVCITLQWLGRFPKSWLYGCTDRGPTACWYFLLLLQREPKEEGARQYFSKTCLQVCIQRNSVLPGLGWLSFGLFVFCIVPPLVGIQARKTISWMTYLVHKTIEMHQTTQIAIIIDRSQKTMKQKSSTRFGSTSTCSRIDWRTRFNLLAIHVLWNDRVAIETIQTVLEEICVLYGYSFQSEVCIG